MLLERFARGALPQAAAEEFSRFEQLLGLPDPVLAGYFLGGARPADPEMVRLVGADPGLCRLRGPSALFSRAKTPGQAMLNFHSRLQSIQLIARRPPLRE